MMKKIGLAVMAALMMIGCDINTSGNGVLDGYWQMTQVDTLETGRSADTRELLVFWSVQGKVLEMAEQSEHGHIRVMFRFNLEGDKLHLSDPIANVRSVSDSIVTSPATVAYYGLRSLNETLDVITLDNNKMVLETEHHLRLHFRKY